jgi:hypothetical protein
MINAVSGAESSSSTDASQAVDANELIADHTDSQGRVDTRGLAALVHQASTEDPGKASAAYAEIENALAAQSPADGSHFAEDTRAAFAAAATTGSAVGALKGGAVLGEGGADAIARGASQTAPAVQTLKDNPILSKEWVGFESAWTGKGGFTGPLKTLLDAQGITYNATPLRSPPGSLNKGSGVPLPQANNINGDLGRDQIAAQQTALGAHVDKEVREPAYSRRIDVRADHPSSDPTHAARTDFEVKVGRTGIGSPGARGEALADGSALRDNAAIRTGAEAMLKDGEGLTRSGEALAKAGRVLDVGGKVLLPVAAAADAAQLYGAFKEDGNTIGVHTGRAAAEVAGGWGGAIAGAEGGAALGSLAGPVGTAIGGVAAGIIGGLGGSKVGDAAFDAGRSAFDKVASWF